MKKLFLIVFHFFAESKKPKDESARPDARPYASEPGIIPIAKGHQAGIFTRPGETQLASTSGAQEGAERA
jgi:hypothetical protein